EVWSVIQKWIPSLQMPEGFVEAPVDTEPRAVRSAALKSETVFWTVLETMTLWPSKAAAKGVPRPLPVRTERIDPVDARTTLTTPLALGTQMLEPSKTGCCGVPPRVTVWRMAPAPLSLKRLPAVWSATQMLAPSKTTPVGSEKPVVTVVAVHGIEAPGVRIEMDDDCGLVVQTFAPSKAMPVDPPPSVLATVVTTPAGWLGSIW